MRLVVSLYQENPDWIMKVPDHWDVVVYIKDAHWHMEHVGLLMKRAVVLKLPNVGRESHTWFHHVQQTYERLDDITVFAQGCPWDHTPNFGEILCCKSLEEMAERIVTVFPPNHLVARPQLGYVGLGCHWYYDTNVIDDPEWNDLEHQGIRDVWNLTYPKIDVPQKFSSVNGAQFAITKELIQKHPRSWYRRIMMMHDQPRHWIIPWSLEKVLPELYLYGELL